MKKIKDTELIANQMRKDNEEILKANSKFIEEKSKKLLIDNDDQNHNKKIKNFNYVNNYVRGKFMNAFLNYNPFLHHINVMEQGQVNEDIKRDYEELDRQIDDDLAEVLDPHYHLKKYNKFKSKQELRRKNSMPVIPTKVNILADIQPVEAFRLGEQKVDIKDDKDGKEGKEKEGKEGKDKEGKDKEGKDKEKTKAKPRHKTILVNDSKRKARKAKEEHGNNKL